MSNLYLQHHGILGQKWGKRNGPPYPLGYEKHSAAEKRLNSKGRIDGDVNTSGGRRHSQTVSSKANREATDDKKEKHKLTEEEKKKLIKTVAIVGASAAAAGLAAYGAYKYGPDIAKAWNGTGPTDKVFSNIRLIEGEHSVEDDLHNVNPGRVSWWNGGLLGEGYKNRQLVDGSSCNCMLCTTAYDLRQRGYDVRAGFSNTGFTPKAIYEWYPEAEVHAMNPRLGMTGVLDAKDNISWDNVKPSRLPWDVQYGDSFSDFRNFKSDFKTDPMNNADYAKSINDSIKAMGPNARGNLIGFFPNFVGGGGHSIIWETDDKGNVSFLDAQTNRRYSSLQNTMLDFGKTTYFVRTDNVEPNKELLFNPKNNGKYVNQDTEMKTYVKHGASVVKNMATTPEGLAVITASAAYAKHKYEEKEAEEYARYVESNKKTNQKVS